MASRPVIGGHFRLLLLFVGSGCAALIYEVVWYQSLSLIVGSNAVSMGVVLATFMGGMALGSLALLRGPKREAHPLRIYAVLELIIAVFGLLIAYALPWAGGLYTAVGVGGLAGILLRGLFCALFLLIPTMAMGATLPVVAGWVRGTRAGVSWVGFFYAANIAGGVLGCLLSAFYLLRVQDNVTASLFAVALNVFVAAGAWLLSREPAPAAVQTASVGTTELEEPGRTPGSDPRRIYLAIGLSGFCALAAEVVWTRNLALLLGGTIYTFALILAAMLIGLGIGSSLGATAARTSARPHRALGACQLLAILGIAWAAWSMTQALPNWPIDARLAPSPWYLFQLDFACALWCVLPAALCWGASFPLAFAAAAEAEHNKARAMARIYAANTGGAITGALLTSLLFISWLGTQGTQRLLIVLAGLAGALVYAPVSVRTLRPLMRPASVAALTLVAIMTLVALASVQPVPGLLVGYGRWAVTWLKYHGDFIYVGEGLNSTLAVSRYADGETLYHNAGKPQASTELQDMRLQRMLGHLTTLLAGDPQRVLVIGCGAGITAGAISVSPAVRQETIVEIEPLVPRAASRYFSEQNNNVIGNPKVRVRIDDARHFLLTTHEKFDAISTDPFDTWVKGAATLNTQEFFEAMKRHLAPGGVVTVWIQFYETDESALKSELATFIKVFPNAIVFGNTTGGQGYDGVMVGSPNPLKIDIDALTARLQRTEYASVRQSLNEVDYTSVSDLLSTFVADGPQLASWLADAQINRDRNLRLQYLAGFGNNNYDEANLYRELVHHGGWSQNLFTGSAASLKRLQETQAKQLLAAEPHRSDSD